MGDDTQSSADSSLLLLPSQELDYRDFHTTQSYERYSQQNDTAAADDNNVEVIKETPPPPNSEISSHMSIEEVSVFLNRSGIPEQYCKVFEDNYIDGQEFLLLSNAEVKSLIKPLGLARKIIRMIPQPLTHGDIVEPTATLRTSDTSFPSTPASSMVGSSVSTASVPKEVEIPDKWEPDIQIYLDNQSINGTIRHRMVRVLVERLFGKYPKPSRDNSEELARNLVAKYPFLKDDYGNRYQSWTNKLMERVHNVIKRSQKMAIEAEEKVTEDKPKGPKRRRKDEKLARYPITENNEIMEDKSTIEKFKSAIGTELARSKPRDAILLPLMKSTYPERRMYILGEPISLFNVLQQYPALKRPAIIEQEMELITGKTLKSKFISNWRSYVSAILLFGKESRKNVLSILRVLKEDDDDDTCKQTTALKVLGECLVKGNLCYLYEENTSMESIDEACKKPPQRTQPYIIATFGEENTQYYVVGEQQVICKVTTLPLALYITFSTFYCFNLEYPPKAKSLFHFFQDYICEIADNTKRSGNYHAIASDIKRKVGIQ